MAQKRTSTGSNLQQLTHSQARLGFLIIGMLWMAATAIASGAGGSKGHDFSKLYGSKELRCYPCHADDPSKSGAAEQAAKVPMWNHQTTQTVYTTYKSQSGNRAQVDSISNLCLSCHDGVSAKATMGNVSSYLRTSSIGTDLTNDHPIGMNYSQASSGRSARTRYQRKPQGNIILTGAKADTVSCISCHDPHGSPYPKMLRESMVDSKLCFSCHYM